MLEKKNNKYTSMLLEALDELEKTDKYPESYSIINHNVFIVGESDVTIGQREAVLDSSPWDIAHMLHDADSTLPMHILVAKFCLEVYFDEYANGNFDAACDLGSLFYTGRAGEQNYAKALEYYTIAADGGCRQAQENLGYCYYYGRDVEKDYEKAFHYVLLGALDGHLRSLYKIGDFYKNGYYVKKNEKEAFYIYERCADTMSDDAIGRVGADVYMRLGECYYKGIGTEVDLDCALRLYQMAEGLFYIRLREGDYMIKGCLDGVIKAEEEVRKLLRESMPDKTIKD